MQGQLRACDHVSALDELQLASIVGFAPQSVEAVPAFTIWVVGLDIEVTAYTGKGAMTLPHDSKSSGDRFFLSASVMMQGVIMRKACTQAS